VVCVSDLLYVCILSTLEIIIKRISRKDQEIFLGIKNPVWPMGRSSTGKFYPAVATAASLELAKYPKNYLLAKASFS
jgi:type IV secretory pathway VirB3-like protein